MMLLRIRYLKSVIQSKKHDYDTIISDIESEYFTTTDYNKFTNKMINKQVKENELV